MIFTILSYFDNIIGPKIFLQLPNVKIHISFDYIPLLMDLYKEGFFIHEFGELKTANLIFEILNPRARGRINRIMISIISIEKEYNLSLSSFREIMEFFVYKFKNIDNLYKGFYYNSMPETVEKHNEIKDFMYSFYQSLNIFKQNMSKIFVYGLSPIGKSNIIKFLQEKFSQSRQQIGNIPIDRYYNSF